MTFTRIIGITVATAVVVFLGLTFLLPRHHEEKAQAATLSPDQVFDASATPPTAGETASEPAAPASNPAAPEPAAAAAPTETAAAAPAAAEPAAPAAPAESSPAPAAAPTQTGLSEEEARKIAEDVGRKVATRVVEEKSAASAPAEPAAPEPSTAAASSGGSLTEADIRRIAADEARRVYGDSGTHAPSKARKAKPAPVAAATEVAASAPAPVAADKPAKPTMAKHVKASDMAGDKAASDAITAWWPATDKQQADRLNLVYAGEAAFEKAVVLMFDSPVDAAAASSNLELYDASGNAVSGSWSSGGNPRMVVFKDVKPGRYTVVLKPELADASGKTLSSGLHGPVYVN